MLVDITVLLSHLTINLTGLPAIKVLTLVLITASQAVPPDWFSTVLLKINFEGFSEIVESKLYLLSQIMRYGYRNLGYWFVPPANSH